MTELIELPKKKLYVAEDKLERKLRLYLKNNFNLLFSSEAGCGIIF